MPSICAICAPAVSDGDLSERARAAGCFLAAPPPKAAARLALLLQRCSLSFCVAFRRRERPHTLVIAECAHFRPAGRGAPTPLKLACLHLFNQESAGELLCDCVCVGVWARGVCACLRAAPAGALLYKFALESA
jgi:hypothetical protein